MTTLKQEHHSHMRVIKGGKHPSKKFSRKSRFYFLKREEKRKQKQKYFDYAKICVETLGLMQKVARAINPAFYFERLVPHYEVLRSSISNSTEAETYSTNIIERELCIYKSFAHLNPQRLQDYNKVLMKGEDEYTSLYKEREENHFDKVSGLRFIAKKMMLYVANSEVELFLEINEKLIQYKDEKLTQLFFNITIHLNFLNQNNHE
ncbi:MAG: hypothetical protein Q7W45_16410 [Bacteroidota bacterium]|nr:hypothetical protein [Bacteroidota bacterium]MDP3145400.1 hypothetical protein [Bacteroidota bacterium]